MNSIFEPCINALSGLSTIFTDPQGIRDVAKTKSYQCPKRAKYYFHLKQVQERESLKRVSMP